jgi:hypothetical protein
MEALSIQIVLIDTQWKAARVCWPGWIEGGGGRERERERERERDGVMRACVRARPF